MSSRCQGDAKLIVSRCRVGVKSMSMITREDAGNVSTFKPLDQKKDSNMKNTGMGYLPCEG